MATGWINKNKQSPARLSLIALPVFILLSVFIRFPFFFEPVFDWDESTFILMGNDILHGYLPYIRLWDNKPPLLFAIFALFISIGKTIWGIRLLGAVWLGVAAWVIHVAERRIYPESRGVWAPLLFLLYSLNVGHMSGPAVMSEHIASLPLALIILLLARDGIRTKDVIAVGLLAGLCLLVRTNLILILPAIFFILMRERNSWRHLAKSTILLGASGLFPAAIAALIYASQGYLTVLYQSAVLAPLGFIQYDVPKTGGPLFKEILFNFWGILTQGIFSKNFLLWLAAPLGLFLSLKESSEAPGNKIIRILILTAFVAISILLSGARFEHYLIQLWPMMAILAVPAFNLPLKGFLNNFLKYLFLAAGLFCATAYLQTAYPFIIKKIAERSMFDNDLYQIAEYLKKNNMQGKYIYACNYQILYFLSDTKVPSYHAHPSNMGLKFMSGMIETPYSGYSRYEDVLKREPVFIINNSHYYYMCTKELGQTWLKEYRFEKAIGSMAIFKKVKMP